MTTTSTSNPFGLLLGTDPEMVAMDTNGRYMSVHDIIPGTKRAPFFVTDGAMQVDGVAGEFNIMPASSEDDFVQKIRSVQGQMQGVLSSARPGCHFVAHPKAWFDEDYFLSLPPVVKLLGCEPDYNAYTMGVNHKPKGAASKPFRTFGFHVHVGLPDDKIPLSRREHFRLAAEMVRQLDNSLFEESLEWDSDEERRTLYGARGSFRIKPFGFEYRPLSNVVLSSDDIIRRVYRTTVRAVTDYLNGNVYETSYENQSVSA